MKILHVCPTFATARCGIGAYTRYLCAAIRQISPETEQLVSDGFQSLRNTILLHKPEVCHIQLEYGFCSPQRLRLIDDFCEEEMVQLVVTFHTLAAQPHNQSVPHAIKLAHTPLAEEYGKFTIIPSGIPNIAACSPVELNAKLSESEQDFLDREPTLFFGQAHPHKQLLEVLKIYQTQKYKNLVCIVSKPVQGNTSYYDQCLSLAQSLPNVCWISDYLEDAEVLALSKRCPIAVFPYEEYGSIGVSAAIKLLLNNAKIRLRTTYASHFSDIPNYQGIATKFWNLRDMLLDIPNLDEDNEYLREKWVASRRFPEVAKQHLKIYGFPLC